MPERGIIGSYNPPSDFLDFSGVHNLRQQYIYKKTGEWPPSIWNNDIENMTLTSEILVADSTFTYFTFNEINPASVALSPDGTRLYLVGRGADDIQQCSLTTPWDLSTATKIPNATLPLTAGTAGVAEGASRDMKFKNDGTVCWVSGTAADGIIEYNLSTAWDITTGWGDTVLNLSLWTTALGGFAFSSDGTKLYAFARGTDETAQMRRWTLSTPWDISTTTVNGHDQLIYMNDGGGTPYVTAAKSIIQCSGMFLESTGNFLYLAMNGTPDGIVKLQMTTPYDLTTLIWGSTKTADGPVLITGTGGTEVSNYTGPDGVTFSPDGKYMYMTDVARDNISMFTNP